MSRLEFENKSNCKKYEVEAIFNSEIYIKKSDNAHLPGPYYVIS